MFMKRSKGVQNVQKTSKTSFEHLTYLQFRFCILVEQLQKFTFSRPLISEIIMFSRSFQARNFQKKDIYFCVRKQHALFFENFDLENFKKDDTQTIIYFPFNVITWNVLTKWLWSAA